MGSSRTYPATFAEMGVRSACRYASFVLCHPAPPSQRVQLVDTTMMIPTATMNTRIRHANSNTLFQSIPGLVTDRFQSTWGAIADEALLRGLAAHLSDVCGTQI